MANCADGVVTWDWIDSHLKGAGYGGPYSHDDAEAKVYEQTAHCTPQIAGFNGTPATTPPSTGTPPSGGAAGSMAGLTSQAQAWITAHPIPSVGIAFLAGYLLLGGKR